MLANDTDDGLLIPLVASLDTDVSDGTLTLLPDGSFEYIPDPGFTGSDSFTYDASDGQFTDTATVTITVNEGANPNTPPTALDDSYITFEDTTINIPAGAGVLANDTDDGLLIPLVASLDTDVSDGTLTLLPDGSFEYIPDTGFTGSDSFTYDASDGQFTDTATVTITVNDGSNPNTPPTALADSHIPFEDTTINIPAGTVVIANDTNASLLILLVASLYTNVSDGPLTP